MKYDGAKINIEFGNEKRELHQELEIDITNLSEELANQPSYFAYYAAMQAEAQYDYDEAKRRLETVRSQSYIEYKVKARANNYKITENELEKKISSDGHVRQISKKVLEKKRQLDMLKVATESFRQRLDALRSICPLERVQFAEPEMRYYKNSGTNKSRPGLGGLSKLNNSLQPKAQAKDDFLKELDKLEKE